MNRNNEKIIFTKEEKDKILEEIQIFFEEEREEKIGILASEKVLDFFMEILGDNIYNKALDDMLICYKRNMDNLESDFYSMYKR